jgi:hypothetical protein
MLESTKQVACSLGEVLISVVGFVNDKIIDLLNIDQVFQMLMRGSHNVEGTQPED